MTAIVTLDLEGFPPHVGTADQAVAVRAIEEGGVLVLPHANFELAADEHRFLTPEWLDGRAKNISVEMPPPGASGGGAAPRIKGARGGAEDLRALTALVTRFALDAGVLVSALFPRYAPYVQQARTSFRPSPAVGRDVSWRKDDSRLHVDAFPSRPNLGARILRVFTNVNPVLPRVWRVGEPFETMAQTLLPRIPAPLPGSAALLSALRVTKARRSHYDHLMLHLHDRAKADLDYQRDCAQLVVSFAPGTTWLCFSDQVMHAAVSGQFMLEQTTLLPVRALYDPQRSPLAILERLTGRPLVPADARHS